MMKHVDYNTAVLLHSIGFDEFTDDLYMNARIGIRAVKTQDDKQIAERIFHNGDLCTRNDEWEIQYPSAHWIPAPHIFDAVNWLDTYMGIKIIPMYNRKTRNRMFDIEVPNNFYFLCKGYTEQPADNILLNVERREYSSLELMYDAALKYICGYAIENNWKTELEDKIFKTMENSIKNALKN